MARRREFDEDALLDCAIRLFWERGYTNTSMSDIALASEVGNGSIYAAYGSKSQLFLVALRRYCAGRVELVRGAMDRDGDVVDVVRGFFEAILDECTEHRPSWGCLMLTSMASLGRDMPEVAELTLSTIGEMETIVAARLERGAARSRPAPSPAPSAAPSTGPSAATRRDLAATVVLASQAILQASLLEPHPARLRRFALSSVERLAPRLAAAA